jgi:site-specific recombinase XerD
MRFHDLRHSCATFLVASGVDLKSVREVLGQTTIRLTVDNYVHAMPENLRAATKAIDRVLNPI